MFFPALTGRILFFSIDVSPLVFYISTQKSVFASFFMCLPEPNTLKHIYFKAFHSGKNPPKPQDNVGENAPLHNFFYHKKLRNERKAPQ